MLASRLPTKTPMRLAIVKGITVPHSTDPDGRRVASATVELTAMTISDVPTASGIEKPSASTSAGTMTKPPPTPKNPVSRPMNDPASTTLTAVARSSRIAVPAGGSASRRSGVAAAAPAERTAGAAACFFRRRHMAYAATSISIENANSSTSASTASFHAEPRSDPPMPARPNTAPAARRT